MNRHPALEIIIIGSIHRNTASYSLAMSDAENTLSIASSHSSTSAVYSEASSKGAHCKSALCRDLYLSSLAPPDET